MSTTEPRVPIGYRLKAGEAAAFDEVAQALEIADGHAPTAAKELGVDSATLYRLLRAHPRLQRVADDLRGVDTSLDVLARLVPSGVYELTLDAENETAEAALRSALVVMID